MVKSECLSEMLAARRRLESSPAHKGPTNTNKMSKFLEERKELNYRAFNITVTRPFNIRVESRLVSLGTFPGIG